MFDNQYSARKVEILFNVPAKLVLNKYQKYSERKNDNILIDIIILILSFAIVFPLNGGEEKKQFSKYIEVKDYDKENILIRRKYYYILCNKNQIISIMHTGLFHEKWTQCPACDTYINTLIFTSYILLILVKKNILSENILLSAIYKRNN